jgi:hypothetical protein
MKNIGVWLKGLLAAVAGGAIAGTAQTLANGNAHPAQLKTAAITGAALTLGAYLTKSPVEAKK